MLGTAQSGRRDASDEILAGHLDGSGGNHGIPVGTGHVVVISIEAPLGDADPGREGVQLLERLVADQVAPHPPTPCPGRRVNQNRHVIRH